ncbi:MAG: hypothetical protein JO278_15990, partial [Dyella sp.]|nr:hypothetical protein [Dyella sp.]
MSRHYPTWSDHAGIKKIAPAAGEVIDGNKGSIMKHEPDTATVWLTTGVGGSQGEADAGQEPGEGVWQNTIAAADHALEEASRIQRGVQQNLKLMQEVR